MTSSGDNGGTSPSQADVGTAVSETGVTYHSAPHAGGGGTIPPEEDLSGQVFAEKYRIERKIGSGGMGQVYLGEHTTIGKTVAIKVLSSTYRARHDIVTRFLGEARAASSLRHENVVDITDFGSTPEGTVFFVMEYLEGKPLDDLMKDEGPLDWVRARDLMLQVLEALAAAHDNGIVHRDMKPDNCFVVPRSGGREHIKVLDFGIAKVMTGEGGEGLTETGAIMGTANYMSPEQAHGERLDKRTDIYSCGVMLYEMIAGRRPFEGNNPMSVMYKHLHSPVPPLLEACPECKASADAEYVILRALAKDREERFQTVQEFADAIRGVPVEGAKPLSLGASGSATAHASMTGGAVAVQSGDGSGRSKAPIIAAAVLGVAALAGVGVWAASRGAGEASGGSDATAAASVARADAVEGDAGGPDGAGSEAAAPGVAEPETAEPERAEPETAAPEVAEPEVAEPETAEPETAKPEATKAATGGKNSGKKATARSGGSRTNRSIGKALASQTKSAVTACLKKGGLFPGESVPAKLSISADGRVEKVKLGGKYGSLPMGKCVIGALEKAKLPAGDGPTTFSTKFSL